MAILAKWKILIFGAPPPIQPTRVGHPKTFAGKQAKSTLRGTKIFSVINRDAFKAEDHCLFRYWHPLPKNFPPGLFSQRVPPKILLKPGTNAV